VGGLERQSFELARLLVERGRQVTVLSTRFDPSHLSIQDVSGVRVYRLDTAGIVRQAMQLARALFGLRHSYDIIHIHNISWVCVPIILTASLLGKPTLIKLPNVGSFGIPGTAKRRLGWVWLRVFKRADAVVAMSDESVDELVDIGYPLTRVLRATNGVATNEFKIRTRSSANHRRVVFLGRLSAEKGLNDLLSVWPDIVARVPGATLEIFGDGDERAALAATIDAAGIQRSVSLKGHIPDVRPALRSAHVFVLPSYAEGNSNAILEAMASGLPVVSTRVGGTQRLVGSSGARFLVTPGDRSALRASLLELLGDETLRLSLGEAMEARAEKMFDIAVVADLYARAYDTLWTLNRDKVGHIRAPAWQD
jgi:glycosyltransferase involved in cell wall biosynthesis